MQETGPVRFSVFSRPPPAPMPAEPARRLDADLFDACFDTEEAHLSAGWAEGERAGRVEGAAEGRALGVSTGFDVGAEVGYYYGAANGWLLLAAQRPEAVSARAARGAAALKAECEAFPLTNPHGGDVGELLGALRGRFRATVAQLGVTQTHVAGRGGAAGSFSDTGAPGDPAAPPEGAELARDLTF